MEKLSIGVESDANFPTASSKDLQRRTSGFVPTRLQ